MSNTRSIKSINAKQYRVLLVIGVLFFVLGGVVCGKELFANRYVDGIGLVMCLFFFVMALITLNKLLNRRVFEISKERIIVKTRFGRKVFRASEIEGFKEEKYEYKHQSGTKLVFKIRNRFLAIDSDSYVNFYEILGFTRDNFKRLEDDSFRKYDLIDNLPLVIILFIGASLFLGGGYHLQFREVDDLNQEIQFVAITLASSPKIEVSKGKGKKKYIQIHTVEYPEFAFKINGFRYNACETYLVTDLQQGDKVSIGIKEEEFNSKIKNLLPPSFGMKHFHWDKIWVYQLNHREEALIDLEFVKSQMKSERKWSWVLLVLGVFSLSMGVGVVGKIMLRK